MRPGDPRWTAKIEERDLALDPLGMNRVLNRMLEDLLPGITTISPRARYISHHVWSIWDVNRREDPETRAEFLEGMYDRERLLLLGSVIHANSEDATDRNHLNIVGVDTADDVIRTADQSVPLDFRFVQGRAGSYGNAYVGPLQTMGLIDSEEGDLYEQPTELGEQIARAYDRIAERSGLKDLVGDDAVDLDQLDSLGHSNCLCRVSSENAPDRELLRDIYLGKSSIPGGRTLATSRGQSLGLILHLARLGEEGAPLSPGSFLDACYFDTIETPSGSVPAEIPTRLEAQAARWKVLQAHDYLRIAAESALVSWLAYLDQETSVTSTIPGFQAKVKQEETINSLQSRVNDEELRVHSRLTNLIEAIWPEADTTDLIKSNPISPVSREHPLSEYTLDLMLSEAVDEHEWETVDSVWPLLPLAMALRFASPTGDDQAAWVWLESLTKSDLSPARFREELVELLQRDVSIGEYLDWFIEQYVILHAEQVRRERESDATQFRGWFRQDGGGWEKVRTHQVSHWSARFYSSVSILRDLALLNPDPDRDEITDAGRDVLQNKVPEYPHASTAG